jgi:hypothetical protein
MMLCDISVVFNSFANAFELMSHKAVAIHPADVESSARFCFGCREEAERQARARIDRWLENQIRYDDGAAYERMMGNWSRIAGEIFLDWLAPPPGLPGTHWTVTAFRTRIPTCEDPRCSQGEHTKSLH